MNFFFSCVPLAIYVVCWGIGHGFIHRWVSTPLPVTLLRVPLPPVTSVINALEAVTRLFSWFAFICPILIHVTHCLYYTPDPNHSTHRFVCSFRSVGRFFGLGWRW